MRILDYRIDRNGIVNVLQEQRQREDIIRRIKKITLTRIAKGLNDWKIATTAAESITNPLNFLLMAVYRDIEIDAHLFALMQTIVLKVLANDFVIENEAGETDEDATELFKKKWFRKFAIHTINSKFYGYSLVQLGDVVDGVFNDAVLVPRDYVNQRLGVMQTSLSSTSDGIPYAVAPFNLWVVGIGDAEDLGLLHKAAPMVIKKKEVVSAWSEAAELFGMPMRMGKTNISSPKNRENMEDMLENMGEAAWGVFDKEDSIEFIQTTKTDFYQIYDKFIDRANSELSKLILLQTGTTDEKAFVGSANVHEAILKQVIESYVLLLEEVVNEKLIPICLQHGIVKKGSKFRATNEQKLSLLETIESLKTLLLYYDVDPAWIEEKFDIPATERATPVDISQPPTAVMAQVKNLYKDFFKSRA